MSKTTRRRPRAEPSRKFRRGPVSPVQAPPRTPPEDRLARLLDSPRLAQIVPQLPAAALHRLIERRGLQACGALVAAATPRQVTAILDLDLWRPPRAGADDGFDEARFNEWIESLMNEGEAVAARVVAAMDRDLVILGLSRSLRVFDAAALTTVGDDGEVLTAGEDAERGEGTEDRALGGYMLRPRGGIVSEAVVNLLTILADDHPACFHHLMRGCVRLSDSRPEEDGLDDLLLAAEQQRFDVAGDRSDRRAAAGFLSAADARAFLELARRGTGGAGGASIDPIAAAYFRDLDGGTADVEPARPPDSSAESQPASAAAEPEVVEAMAAITAILEERQGPAPSRRALPGQVADGRPVIAPLQPLMEALTELDATAAFERSRELAYLANALMAGGQVQGRPFTAQEAWDAASGICNLGLERQWLDHAGPQTSVAETWLATHDLIVAFGTGWQLLYRDVGLFVSGRLAAALRTMPWAEEAADGDLMRLRRELDRHRSAGTPWLAREALDVVATLDAPCWVSLRGLLGECPVLPVALVAIVEGRTGAISPTAFDWFSTAAQIELVHRFAARLQSLLSGAA